VNRHLLIIILICVAAPTAWSQKASTSRVSQYVDLTGTVGASQGSVAGSFVHNWKLGSRKRFEIGVGGRWTSYFGSKKDFLTSGPAKYTRSYTVPFVIFFAGQEEQNFDTLTLQRPLTHSVNVMINLGYSFAPKWYAGCNIDVIGFTFGRKTSGVFTSNGITVTDPAAKPSSFNLLLTGDHDKGTLNSEFYLRYKIAERWSVKALYQFLFVEYQSQMISQTFPDGEMNDLFRNKANNLGLGVSYFFK